MTKNKSIKLVSVVFSFRNEEENIPELVLRTCEALKDEKSIELIFVNDASTDGSELLLKKLMKKFPIKIVNMSRRFGVAHCIIAGLSNAKGDVVIYMDSDLQDPPELIPELIKKYKDGAEVVHTKRTKREGESYIKLLVTKIAYKIINFFSELKLEENAGDFKLLSKRAVNEMLLLPEYSTYIRGLSVWVGFKQEVVLYDRLSRANGNTKFPLFSRGPITEFIRGLTAFSVSPLLLSLLFSVLQKKKIIVCPRGSFSFFTLNNKRPFIKLLWLNFFIKPMVNKIFWQASSYLEERDILNKFPNADIEIINDGIDYDSFQNSITVSRNELLNKFIGITFDNVSNILFSMGRLHKIKGFDVLIDSFNLFLEKDKYAKLIIAGGDDGVGKQLKNQIKKLNLGSSVFLIGPVNFEDKKLLLNNCDYFTLASEFESFGIVIAEALSCGKPVVVSNKTPWKDISINNCGILADNEKNSFNDAFSEIIIKKYDSSLIKNYVKKNYDWAVIVDKFINLIENK